MAMKIITAIGDSIVDTVGRSGVGDTDQWLYKLMQALGQTDIRLEPLPEFGVTPNILQGRWTDFPALCDGLVGDYQSISDATYTINLSPYYASGTSMFAVRVYTQGSAFTLRVYTSMDGINWLAVPDGTLSRPADHGADWSFCNWPQKLAKYVKIEVIGTMNISELQVVANIGNDRGSCLNKMVGQDYIVNNVGLGSQQTQACLDRFVRDVIDLGTDTVMILAGINDIYQNVLPALTQERLMAMYDLADEAGIKVIPITLLPYTGDQSRFDEITSKVNALNSWIRSTAEVRRYGLCDWYDSMEEPSTPGKMKGPQNRLASITHVTRQDNVMTVECFEQVLPLVKAGDIRTIPSEAALTDSTLAGDYLVSQVVGNTVTMQRLSSTRQLVTGLANFSRKLVTGYLAFDSREWMSLDGVHLSILGNTKIVEAFDLEQLAVVTHDFYAVPVFMIPFTASRSGEFVNFTVGNNIETSYQIFKSATAGVTAAGTLVQTISGGTGALAYQVIEPAYYRAYGINTGVWTEEIFVAGAPLPPPIPSKTPTKSRIGIGGAGVGINTGIRARQ